MVQEIFIIDNEIDMLNQFKEAFKYENNYKFKSVKTHDLEIALKNIPALIIINEDDIDRDILEVCDTIREDDDNSITPIIVCSSNADKNHRLQVLSKSIEYYILKPVDNDYLYYTIKNIIRFMYMNRRVSPLTGLPGNVQIHAEMKKRLLNKENFAIMYFDLDNFKAYNDIYGFVKGDEIIKFTSRIILEYVHAFDDNNSFVGHIGGDDFIAIVSSDCDYESICQDIIANFDVKVLNYFNEDDRKKGYLEVANRKNVIEQFPLTSISIGVVDIKDREFNNILEIGEIGAQVKHMAKVTPGSSYIINRRR